MSPVPATAAVMVYVAGTAAPPCYSDLPACDRSVIAPGLTTGDTLPEPAVAAIVGLAILGVALGRRRTGLPHVVS